MIRPKGEIRRVLAVEPISKGFGYAVLEGPESLVDWGVKRSPKASNDWCLRQVGDLLDQFHLDLLVIEDAAAKGSRRSPRIRELLQGIRRLARTKKVPTRILSRRSVHRAFGSSEPATKDRIAARIAQRFPVLLPKVPPPRKPWKSEDHRLAIFTAAALGLTLFRAEGGTDLV